MKHKNPMLRLLLSGLFLAALCHTVPAPAQQKLLSAQELAAAKTYYDVAEALREKDQVYQLNIRQQQYYSFTPELCELVNLQFINAMKNKMADVSPEIGRLQ